jgi:tRNA (cmo5U34)-methyltransferase
MGVSAAPMSLVEDTKGEPAGGAWRQAEVAHAYLEDRRRAMPLWAEQADLLCRLIDRVERPIRRLLDLGAGDGVLSEIILDRHPLSEAVLVDFSRPMLDAAASRLESRAGRWRLVEADLSSPEWVNALPAGAPYDAVVSGLCIHHLPHERKRQLYEEVFGLLAAGGAFLNWEHVAVGEWAQGMFDERMVEGLVRLERTRPEPRAVKAVASEYRARPDAAENKLLDPQTQCEWLRSIGFERVDVFFRWLELALLGGIRPPGGGGGR